MAPETTGPKAFVKISNSCHSILGCGFPEAAHFNSSVLPSPIIGLGVEYSVIFGAAKGVKIPNEEFCVII